MVDTLLLLQNVIKMNELQNVICFAYNYFTKKCQVFLKIGFHIRTSYLFYIAVTLNQFKIGFKIN